VVRIRIRASSITPLTFPPCTYGCIAEPTQLFTTSLLRAASLCCIHIHTFTYIKYLTSHGTFELHGRGYMPSRRYGRSETCPPHVRLLHVATTVMGTGTAAHYTADDTGRDEVKSEHVPLPTGGIGRMPLVPLQGGREVGGGLPHTAKCRVSPRASCRELSVGTCRCVVLLWLCTPALFLLPAACGGAFRSRTACTRLVRSARFVYCGAQGAWRMQAERALFSLVRSCR
jgi:hypothetical protein